MLLHASSPRLRRVWSSASRQAAASRCLSAPYYLIPSLHSFLVVRSRAARDDRSQLFNGSVASLWSFVGIVTVTPSLLPLLRKKND